MSFSWYVLHSKPNREQFLFSQLQHRNIETYYPRLKVEPINPRARKVRPFFPGYLFVRVDFEKIPLSSLNYVPGAQQVVSFDYKPAIVPDDVVCTIKENVENINHNPKKIKKHFEHGDPVFIKGGPFEGYQAIFDTDLKGSDRVRLLIKLIHGQQFRVQVPKDMAEPKDR
jgi:transcriptional antiterminator RfaH